MIASLVVVALIMSLLNWALFVYLTLKEDIPDLKKILNAIMAPPAQSPTGMGAVVAQSAIDPNKLAAATGSLAGAFKKAGPAPTAAAMSIIFFLLSLIAVGVGKF